ncbi:MAG: hypothetical protein FJW37_15640 [Acidobacteria bacterium]|nr:hypothetical protein [Acidobacteriota bacterium]
MTPDPNLRNPQVAHETTDADLGAVLKFGFWLAAVLLVLMSLVGAYFFFLARREAARSPAPPPLASELPQAPPSPRLQAAPRLDLRGVIQAEEGVLGSYGWVDPARGIARIPVAQAMDLIAERGPAAFFTPAPSADKHDHASH